MKFDVCIGNPPYQDPKVGSTQQLWFNFIKESRTICNTMCMIHPGRWVIPTAVYEKYRKAIIDELNCTSFKYIPKSGDVFNNVAIDGGITITYFDNSTNETEYYVNDEYKGIYNITNKIFSDSFEEEIYTKVFEKISGNMQSYITTDFCALGHHSYAHIKNENIELIKDTKDNIINSIRLWISRSTGRSDAKYKWYYIEKENLVDVPDYIFKTRKVMLDSKGHAIAHGKGNVINNLPQICDKHDLGYGVIFVIPKTERERVTAY